jgi:hypothetical protein
VLAGSSFLTAVRLAAWLALSIIGWLDILRVELPRPLLISAVLTACPFALAGLITTLVSIWRGPALVPFPVDDAVLCMGEDSEPVRAYARVKGTIGGAGHVYPIRLVYPALTWGAVLLIGAKVAIGEPLDLLGPWLLAIAVASAMGAWLFPSRPYWYREVMGGGALVSPSEAVGALIMREKGEDAPGVAAVHSAGQPLPILRQYGADVASTFEERFTSRLPRYAVHRVLTVTHGGQDFEVATINISERGLAVRWPVEVPVLDERVVVKLANDSRSCGFDAVICWHRPGSNRDRCVGLELSADEHARRAWREFLDVAVGGAVSA